MPNEIPFNGKELDPASARAIADDVLIQGARPIEWWRRQSNELHNKFMDTVRQSMENGEGIDKLRKRIGGGVIDGVEVPGIMKAAKHNAEALGRTAINKVSNEARLRTFEENGDVVKGVKQVSTLDNRTSVICVAYSNKTWSLPDYEPIAPTTLPFNGGPPRHFNCRSTIVPILKSWEELGIPASELKPTTRASMDGQVPADTTFDAFLKKKGKAFQDKLLGPVRARLWRSGKITLQQMLDFRGQPLSPDELLKLAKKKRVAAQAKKVVTTTAAAAAAKPAPKPAEQATIPPETPVPMDIKTAKPTERKWHGRAWLQGTPDYLQRTIDKAPPLKAVRSNRSGSFYQPMRNVEDGYISMDKRPGENSLRALGTWRHEYGHHLDWTYARQKLTAEELKATGGHISATFFKQLSADAKEIIGNVDIQRGIARQKKLLKDAVDSGDAVAYLDTRLRQFGFTYQEMAELHAKNLGLDLAAEGGLNGVIMQNRMAHVITALKTKDMHHYLVQVWWGNTRHGIGGKIADYYGSMTRIKGSGPKVGWGHSEHYYTRRDKGNYGQTTEAMANVLAILGAEPQWLKFMKNFGGMRFFNKIEDLLKAEAGK